MGGAGEEEIWGDQRVKEGGEKREEKKRQTEMGSLA